MFSRYVALGDSMSIDRYPSLDVASRRRIAPALFVEYPIGAAALFARNDAAFWPEFEGRDLASLYPGMTAQSLAEDGATIGDVFIEQLPKVEKSGGQGRTLVTLTAGGNDLLSAVAGQPGEDVLGRAVRDIAAAYRELVAEIRRRLPGALLVLTTVYDPTDGTGKLPGVFKDFNSVPIHHLLALNGVIRSIAGEKDTRLADAQAHFQGHGVSVAARARWYWKESLIEPSSRGASEIRRLWLEAIEAPETT